MMATTITDRVARREYPQLCWRGAFYDPAGLYLAMPYYRVTQCFSATSVLALTGVHRKSASVTHFSPWCFSTR